MLKLAQLVGVALVVAAISAGITLVIAERPGSEDKPTGTPIAPGVELQAPGLSDAQVGNAKRIATEEAKLKTLLGEASTSVESVWPWFTEDMKLIGAGVTLRLDKPATLEADWPLADFDDQSATGYSEKVAHFKASEVTTIEVLVDFDKGTVVEIQPGSGSNITEPTDARPVAGPVAQ